MGEGGSKSLKNTQRKRGMKLNVCVCWKMKKKSAEAGKKLKLSGELDTKQEETTLTSRRRRRRCCCRCRRRCRRQVQSVMRAWQSLWAIYVCMCVCVHLCICACTFLLLFVFNVFLFVPHLLLVAALCQQIEHKKATAKTEAEAEGKRNTATIFSYEVIVGSDDDGD